MAARDGVWLGLRDARLDDDEDEGGRSGLVDDWQTAKIVITTKKANVAPSA